jgi:hypothetical protein
MSSHDEKTSRNSKEREGEAQEIPPEKDAKALLAAGAALLGGFALRRLLRSSDAPGAQAVVPLQPDPSEYQPPRFGGSFVPRDVDPAIANLGAMIDSQNAPRKPTGLPSLSSAPAAESQCPPLTAEALEAFLTLWTFFLGGELPNDAPHLTRGTDRIYRVSEMLPANWLRLDPETRAWITRAPAIWPVVQAEWRKRPTDPWRQKEFRDYFQPKFFWFEEKLAPKQTRPTRVRPIRVPPPPT